MRIQFFTTIICLFVSSLAFTQQTFGHINAQEIIAIMPEAATAQLALQQEAAELEKQLQEMATELESKYKDFELKQAGMSETMRNDQAKSLQDLQERIVAFQQSAQQSLTLKETQLLEPIYQKIQDAIDKVAAEKGYSYIFNTSDINTSIIWKDDAFDITNQVKTKLKL